MAKPKYSTIFENVQISYLKRVLEKEKDTTDSTDFIDNILKALSCARRIDD
jgi:hypothetical protein